MVEPDIRDDVVDFGVMKMPLGKAYLTGRRAGERDEVQVSKWWTEIDGRRFLIESIPLDEASTLLAQLPEGNSIEEMLKGKPLYAGRRAPAPSKGRKSGQSILTAGLDLKRHQEEAPQFVMDYVTVNSSLTNYVFKGDTTYYVSATVNLYGTTTWEGGTVLKYAKNVPSSTVAILKSYGSLEWRTDPYRPAVFTAKDDDSVGQTISGSTGSPSGIYGMSCLELMYLSSSQVLENLRFSYAGRALAFWGGSGFELKNAQFVDCETAMEVSDTVVEAQNILVDYDGSSQYSTAFTVEGTLTVVNGTIHGVEYLLGYQDATFTNCLFVSIANLGTPDGAHNATNSSSAVFQTVGAGAHYLADNTYRNAGSTNISAELLDDLATKTTYPPIVYSNVTINTDQVLSQQAQRDSDVPDLGYHYDAVDYASSDLSITNATLTLANGVALAMFGTDGIILRKNGRLVSEGTPASLNRLVQYQAVQEQSEAWGSTGSASTLIDLAGPASSNGSEVELRFTSVSRMAASTAHRNLIDHHGYQTSLAIQDSEIYGVYLNAWAGTSGSTHTFSNNLFNRSTSYFFQESGEGYGFTALLFNNLFHEGLLDLYDDSVGGWTVRDNLFDNETLSTYGSITASHNAFASGLTAFGSTNVTGVIPDYQDGALGDYYYPTTGTNLAQLIDEGSRDADDAGLYHYTTTTNQVKETNSVVDIGYHYAATDGDGIPLDEDGDGLPDYLEDADGNGDVDSGETDWEDATDLGLRIWITRPKDDSIIP